MNSGARLAWFLIVRDYLWTMVELELITLYEFEQTVLEMANRLDAVSPRCGVAVSAQVKRRTR